MSSYDDVLVFSIKTYIFLHVYMNNVILHRQKKKKKKGQEWRGGVVALLLHVGCIGLWRWWCEVVWCIVVVHDDVAISNL